MTTLYLIRHCETVANESHLLQGSRDFPISERGKRQLEYLGKRFETVEYDTLYSSPQPRAFATAEAVRGARDIGIITDAGLQEMNCGKYEGEPLFEHFKKDPDLEYKWKHKPHLLDLEGGESATAVYARMRDTVLKIVEKNRGKTVAVASHGFAIRCFLSYLEFGCVEKLGDVDISGNTSVSKIEFYQDGGHKIVYANDVEHLPDDLKTFFKSN